MLESKFIFQNAPPTEGARHGSCHVGARRALIGSMLLDTRRELT